MKLKLEISQIPRIFTRIFSCKINFVFTILKIGLIILFFTVYTVSQYFIYHRFIDKYIFSLTLLIHAQSRGPYLAKIFNSYRGEIIEGGSIGTTDYGYILLYSIL